MNFDIEMNQVTVRYGNVEALKNISLKLPYGKLYGLLGRNGAGKTTLLSLLGSFLEPTVGTVRIGGMEVFDNEKVMPWVTFVYDSSNRDEHETVKGMLEAAERYRPTFDREYANYLVKRFQLPLDQLMKQLSKGQQAAVRVTVGLANRSPITILDEAYLGMDAPTRETFYKELLEDHSRNPRTVILSTHHVSEVEHLFEEVIILHQGSILLQETMDQVLECGVSVTGDARAVDGFIAGMQVLHTERLGGTKRAMVYGKLSEDQLLEAGRRGIEIGSVSLQHLFIHLTEEGNADGVRKGLS
ncbi:ABC-2 type transport system ATP-binding protein [Planifilum fimeticola]|uniref:ABC-2 type transport system ATP-binding protein n=1 Tax=Planifilum fimeticola TaxID=201975 RepID=A0A2T0LIV8_9BACL|nr:ABC transporter ATP-binding protein [Planifilum fimeticola]PRX42370.1 ABC-2 type transport system ATP-binding protein [Planifilum fimeticola]